MKELSSAHWQLNSMPLPYHSRVAIFASPAAGITAIEIVHFTTFVKWAAIGII